MPKHVKHTRARKHQHREQRSKRQRWMERATVVILDAECKPVIAELVSHIEPRELNARIELSRERLASPAERAYLNAQ